MQENAKEDPGQSDKKLAELRAEDQRLEAEIAALEGDKPKAVPDNGGFRKTEEFIKLDVISAKELQQLDIPPAEFVIENFLPVGLGIFGGPPKSYKSYAGLDMSISVATGTAFLGFQTKKAGVLYLDLESTRRRPKNRIDQILQGVEAPENLYIATKSLMLGKGFEESIREEKKKHPDIKLIIVDVFKKIRPAARKNVDAYERDYEDYGAMKALADELDVSMLLIVHTTKMKHPDDPFNELSGSIGATGSADVSIVICKDKREDETAKLYITGRDLESQCYEIKFNKQKFRWEMQGTHKDMEQLRLELAYRSSPIVTTVKTLLNQNNGRWSGTVSELIKASQYFKSGCIHGDPRKVGSEINDFIGMFKNDGICFQRGKEKNTKRFVSFSYLDVSDVSVVDNVSDISVVSNEWEYCDMPGFKD